MRATPLSPEFAYAVIVVIGAVGFTVWLGAVALWWATRKARPVEPRVRELAGKDAQQVRDAMPRAAALQQPVWDLVGGDARHAVFELPVPGTPRVRADVEPLPTGCRVTCQVEPAAAPAWYTWLMPAWLALEPVAILAIGAVLWVYAAPHANPGVRGQAFQMAQIVHVLWAPFLFWFVRRRSETLVRGLLDRFITTLELL